MKDRTPGMFDKTFEITFTAGEREKINRDVGDKPWGGHQALHDTMQRRIASHSTITVTDAELVTALRYGYGYGTGTWQKPARAVLAAGVRAGYEVPTSSADTSLQTAIERYWEAVK